MGFLAPLFLLGAAAIALPFWLHRLQTKSSDRRPFSSAMLLESSEQQVHVQRQLKYYLLLAFRVAMLLALAAAFAKPFLDRPPLAATVDGAGSQLVIVDTSLSMDRRGALDQALAAGRQAIDAAPNGALIQVLSAAGLVRPGPPPSTDKPAHRRALAELTTSFERLDYGALMQQVETLAGNLPAPVIVHLISDFQETGMPAQFADVVPRGVAELVAHPVGTALSNWSIEAVRHTESGFDVAAVNHDPATDGTVVRLQIDGVTIDTAPLTGAGRQAASFADIKLDEGAYRIVASLDTDDGVAGDDERHAVVTIEPPQAVPLLTANPGGLPVTYLAAALESAGDGRFSALPLVLGDFDPRILSRYPWAVVDDLGGIDAVLAGQLQGYLDQGGSLLVFVADNARGRESLPVTGHSLAAVDLTARVPGQFATVAELDADHPALAATEGWHRVAVAETVLVDSLPDDRIMARLDNGNPFMIERQAGNGRVLMILSGLDNRWNDLPVHPVFVGFVLEAAEYLSGRTGITSSYTVGDTLPLSLTGGSAGQVVDPDGQSVLSLADTARAQVIRLDKPGIYQVYTPEGETLVAVNVDPRESDLQAIASPVLTRWRDATRTDDRQAVTAPGQMQPRRVDLWPWLLLLLAMLAIAESALGNVHLTAKMRAS